MLTTLSQVLAPTDNLQARVGAEFIHEMAVSDLALDGAGRNDRRIICCVEGKSGVVSLGFSHCVRANLP
jgi:hypothetical protein